MASYRFKLTLVPTLVVLVLLPLLVGLGFWQLDRAGQKQALQRDYLQRGQMSPLELGGQRLDPKLDDLRRATGRGRFEPLHQILLDNRVHHGQPGFHVLTPLHLEGTDRRILVNRGWIPWSAERHVLPSFDTPSYEMVVSGRLRRPATDYFTLEDESGPPPQDVWQNLNLARYQRVVAFPVEPLILELDGNAVEAGGFVREWPDYRDSWVERHRGYAFQWFALSAALVIIYVLVNIQPMKQPAQKIRL